MRSRLESVYKKTKRKLAPDKARQDLISPTCDLVTIASDKTMESFALYFIPIILKKLVDITDTPFSGFDHSIYLFCILKLILCIKYHT